MINRLNNERGVTLLETLATSIIVALALISIYIGILYADKQVQRNYHDRVATLLASGELDWQVYYKKDFKMFDLFTNRPVTIDRLNRGTLKGTMSVTVRDTYENPFGLNIPYSIVEVSVSWIEPGDNKVRKIVVREDFY